ncbi:MAG: hypothetical protein ABIN97_19170 [Ginsengibacter sp.]
MDGINLKIIFYILLSFIMCTTSCLNNSEKEKSRIFLYRRDSGSNNGYETYLDLVAITNYNNKSMTIDSFANIAKKYIDTVKANLPVSDVLFIGQKPGHNLPNPNPDNEQEKYYLIDIGFNNSIRDMAPNQKVELRDIAIWRDGEVSIDEDWDRMMPGQDLKIDSALKSKLPFDNGF